MHNTPALTFDSAAARAWLHQPVNDGLTRAEALGVQDELFVRVQEQFLSTVSDVLAAGPDGLQRRPDVTDILLWLIPDDEILDQGAIITVDLANGVRLASPHQDLKDFADRDQHGINAVLAALTHITHQVQHLVDTYARSETRQSAHAAGVTTTTAGTPPPPPQVPVFSERQVSEALIAAADDILAAVEAGPEGLRDSINLTVNAAMSYLTGQATDLHDVVAANYSEDYPTVLGWVEAAA
ncbi:hypothetical protein EDC02_7679 [Micromonospora sp. Llam0]|uniref:hypothetical protein n=1 Tax=Micromonospora sp. Llam0 TaxID=2485143 RepID=UPI000F46E11D|nr:hypothetical protein [Micromonospora sp. Llam0]ROO52738.1 hypothetical protein EDC02_7679 [Micromonospora sp. Llam0]